MAEREPPDLDRVRDALREHDERREIEDQPPEGPSGDDPPPPEEDGDEE